MKEAYRTRNSPGVLILTADADAHLDGSPLIVEGVAELPDGSQIVRRAEGPGMMVAVTGATLQGSVDRQRAAHRAVAGAATSGGNHQAAGGDTRSFHGGTKAHGRGRPDAVPLEVESAAIRTRRSRNR